MEGMDREQTTVRLPSDLKQWLWEEADRLAISFNAVVVMILQKEREEGSRH